MNTNLKIAVAIALVIFVVAVGSILSAGYFMNSTPTVKYVPKQDVTSIADSPVAADIKSEQVKNQPIATPAVNDTPTDTRVVSLYTPLVSIAPVAQPVQPTPVRRTRAS